MCRARLRAVRACALVRRKPGSHARQARAIGVQVEILGQGQQFDVLVVDDSSPDGTGDLVAHMAAPHLPRPRRRPVEDVAADRVGGRRDGAAAALLAKPIQAPAAGP